MNLTDEQINAAAIAGASESTGDFIAGAHWAIGSLAAPAPASEAVALLQSLEWAGSYYDSCGYGRESCLICSRDKRDGHATDCKLSKALATPGTGDSADAPVQQAETANTERLAFLQQHRVALIPEYEGPWDAEVYGESEAPIARGSGNTPHAAIDDVRAALKGEQPVEPSGTERGNAA